MRKLHTYTLPELKLIARESDITVPNGIKKKDLVAILESADGVIKSPDSSISGPVQKMGTIKEGIVGIVDSTTPEVPSKPLKDPTYNKVALYSIKNLSWAGVGKLNKGYNFVNEKEVSKWLTHRAVREASPEEIAQHYGISTDGTS